MFQVPEKYRFNNPGHYLSSTKADGNNGVFLIPFKHKNFTVIASDGMGWEHVSVSIEGETRTPTWEEMCFIKDMFWSDDACVVQYHPPRSEYVNNHDYCLHLWRPVDKEIPLPDSILVGIK